MEPVDLPSTHALSGKDWEFRKSLGTVLLLFVAWSANMEKNLAETPPFGWNSFDNFGVYMHAQAALANLEVFAEK